MAANYVYTHPDAIEGIAFLASYPANSNPLTDWDGEVISLYGTLDGVAQSGKIESLKPLLPESTLYIPIEGGNHAQFGDYGLQGGDGTATISAEEQWAQTVEALLAWLERVGAEG